VFPTIQNFRQFWKTLYKRAVAENREQIKFVSEEDGKKDYESDERDYIDDVVNRQHVRGLGREYFGDVLDLGELPELVREELDQDQHGERQPKFTDHDFGT
jgi:hypothetical protein